jgi:hypothetical protein
MACCQKATGDEAKGKRASQSRETAPTDRDRSRQALLWLHYAKHLAVEEDYFTTFVVKLEKILARRSARCEEGTRREGAVPGGSPRQLVDFSVVRGIFLWRAPFFYAAEKPEKSVRGRSRSFGKGRTLE